MTEIKTYLVGGYVRDQLLDVKSKDKDYAVEGTDFVGMREWLLESGHEIFVEKEEFGTIRAKIKGGEVVDYTLCREDGPYSDGRHPDWVSTDGATIYSDLKRRDFTVNAIAIDSETGEFIDPHEGQKDLKDRTLRAVGSPKARLSEDPLRAFRAVRFAVTKEFDMDYFLIRAIDALVYDDFESVSADRIREELTKAFHVDSFKTMWLISGRFPTLGRVMEHKGVWLKPTLELR